MAPAAPPSMSRQLFATDGLLARSVEDLALLAPIMAQPDARDPRYTPAEWREPDGPLDIAILAGEPLDAGPAEAMRRATQALEHAGHRLHETPVPHLRGARAAVDATCSPTTPARPRSRSSASTAAPAR